MRSKHEKDKPNPKEMNLFHLEQKVIPGHQAIYFLELKCVLDEDQQRSLWIPKELRQ